RRGGRRLRRGRRGRGGRSPGGGRRRGGGRGRRRRRGGRRVGGGRTEHGVGPQVLEHPGGLGGEEHDRLPGGGPHPAGGDDVGQPGRVEAPGQGRQGGEPGQRDVELGVLRQHRQPPADAAVVGHLGPHLGQPRQDQQALVLGAGEVAPLDVGAVAGEGQRL